jgi:acetyl esterase/lipase
MRSLLLVVSLLAACTPTPDEPVVGDDDDTPFAPPEWCPAPETGIQEIQDTPAAPYFVQHPLDGSDAAPIVLYLPGGAGLGGPQGQAMRTWVGIFGGDLPAMEQVRIVMPFVNSGDFPSDAQRTHAVADEIRTCFGPGDVHLGGTSAGGNAAFELMQDDSSRYATLATQPGCLGDYDVATNEAAFAGKRVLNGVGGDDAQGWQDCVESSHDFLAGLGVDSTHEVFEGVGHVVPNAWDGAATFFAFWLAD